MLLILRCAYSWKRVHREMPIALFRCTLPLTTTVGMTDFIPTSKYTESFWFRGLITVDNYARSATVLPRSAVRHMEFVDIYTYIPRLTAKNAHIGSCWFCLSLLTASVCEKSWLLYALRHRQVHWSFWLISFQKPLTDVVFKVVWGYASPLR
jgi:hypothetical protein